MLSYIELVDIPAGIYELVVSIDKALFMPPFSSSYQTCLTFDLNLEHVPLRNEQSNLYQVIGILPEKLDHLSNTSEFKVELKFDKTLTIADLIPTTSFIERLCRLETDDGSIQVAKKAVVNSRSSVEFYFNFKGMLIEENQRCYQIKCPSPA
jgi:hypothetical protein